MRFRSVPTTPHPRKDDELSGCHGGAVTVCGAAADREEVVMAIIDGSKLVRWLDVPDGPLASGEAACFTGT